jgi:hypothetical protein
VVVTVANSSWRFAAVISDRRAAGIISPSSPARSKVWVASMTKVVS